MKILLLIPLLFLIGCVSSDTTSELEIELDKSQGLNSVFSQLSEHGVKVLSMRNKANRLEELFVSIVRGGNQ